MLPGWTYPLLGTLLAGLVGSLGMLVGAPAAFAMEPEGAAVTVSRKPLVYVAIGASDAVGEGADDPLDDGWVPRLANRLGPDTQLVNLGIPASRLHQALQEQLPAAVAADPDLVTVWLAVNDFNDQVPLPRYAADLELMLSTLRAQTDAHILVANVPDLSLVANYASVDPFMLRLGVQLWNGGIASVAERNGALLVNLFAAWAELATHPELVSADGFHPSSAGYARLAEAFYAAVPDELKGAPDPDSCAVEGLNAPTS